MDQLKAKRPSNDVAGCSKKMKEISELITELKFLRSPEMTELFSLCLGSINETEIQSVVETFWDIFKVDLMTRNESDCGIYRIAFMCLIEYIYKTEEADVFTISKVIYGYLSCIPHNFHYLRYMMELSDKKLPLLKALPCCTLYTQWKPEFVTELIYQIACDGRYGFLQFLVKYTKCPFQPKISTTRLANYVMYWIKVKQVIAVESDYKKKMQLQLDNLQSLESAMASEKDTWLARIKCIYPKFRSRRLIFTLFLMDMMICYRESRSVQERLNPQETYLQKSKCWNLMIEATTEPYICHRDIEKFCDIFLDAPYSFMLSEAMRDYAKELSPDMEQDPSPRKLEDLSRCKLRECLQDQTTLPEQVSNLPLPPPLKQFILFNSDEIGEKLMHDHVLCVEHIRSSFIDFRT